uniref:F-box domain-containing protein n=1 Tax=Kalanchoe fedtschenkoi TaxID=63787 RepID=A0A7N0UJ78_KALFE
MDSRSRTVEQRQLPALPLDVLHNILSRLPVKSLMRFRCVSKSLDALVRDPQFVKLHFDRTLEDLDKTDRRRIFVTTNPPQCILCENLDEDGGHEATTTIEYPSAVPAGYFEIVGSCNGLLCFMVLDTYTADCKEDYKFVLWNPSTRACRELAKPPGPLLGHFPDAVPIYGFGYDPVNDDYKIIRAVSPDPGTTSTCLEIYTLKDNAWRQIQASLPCVLTAIYWRMIKPSFPGISLRGAGLHTNGAVHWLEIRNVDTPDESDLILSFNLASEQFEEVIPLPDFNKEDSQLCELQVLRGHLSLIVQNGKTCEIDIWVMGEYGVKGSWTKIVTMPNDPGPEFEEWFMDDWFIPFSR